MKYFHYLCGVKKRCAMRNTIIITLLCSLCMLGCGRQPHYRVGVSQCLDDAWRQKMNDEMSRELLLHPEIELSTRIAYGSNALQCAQIDSFVCEKVDLLIVSPNEAEAVRPAVTRAYRAGIPVIVADRRVVGNEWTSFIGGDNRRVGELMAQWIIGIQATSSQPIHVLEVTGLPGSTPAILRHDGMMAELDRYAQSQKPQPVIESVMGSWFKEDAYKVVVDYLRTHKQIEVIVAQNDLMAIGAAEAVRDSRGYGKGSVRIMGVDGIYVGLQAICDGVIECSATYSSRGDMVIATAAGILEGKPYIRDTVLETMMVDATAARPMLMQFAARKHDLETMELVQVQTDLKWQKMRSVKKVMITVIVLVSLLFLIALTLLIWMQDMMRREIKRVILPQLTVVEKKLEDMQLSQRDVAFAERMKQIVDDHLTDPNLNVEYLGSALQLSRTQIFRRVKSITGKGPLDYIRERRLIRADELLRTTDMTIQQVALELCFSSPGYFTKCYKEYFGKLPSER